MFKNWRSRLLVGLVGVAFLPNLGCDTRASKMEELKRRAIRRPKDDDGNRKPAAVAKQNVPKMPPKDESKEKREPENAPPTALPAAPVADSKPARPKPESLIDQRSWALQSLEEIAVAFQQRMDENDGIYMPQAILDGADVPLLSWRVALLPYLGHQELYDKFALDQPWDSRTNLALLKEIPDVFKSADRMDEKTNFLVPVGTTTLFSSSFSSVSKLRIEDGLNNTICVFEVDDALAVPWTQPVDFDVRQLAGIGSKRKDGIFVAFADGTIRRIPNTVKPNEFNALLTIDGGEPVTMAKLSFAVAADPTRATEIDDKAYSELAKLGGLGAAVRENESASPVSPELDKPEIKVDDRPAAPTEVSLADSRKIFRELYGPAYQKAKTPDEKAELAKELFEKGKAMVEDIHGRFVVLQAARVVAVEAQDSKLAGDIITELVKNYRIDDQPLRSELLLALGSNMDDVAIEMAKDVAETALLRDDFETASNVLRLAAASQKKEEADHSGRNRKHARGNSGDEDRDEELHNLRRRVESGRAEYRRFRKAMETVDEGSPEAYATVGSYLCFVKDDWEKGLPLLAKSEDPELSTAAQMELNEFPAPVQQLEIAEAWWEYGEGQKVGLRHVIWKHAALWYLSAYNRLPDGLLRVKAEMRINTCSNELGSEVVNELRARLSPAARRSNVSVSTRDDDDDD